MFLTQEDYKKIESWLKLNSKKDTDFPESNILTGNEYIAIVQDGENKKVSITKVALGGIKVSQDGHFIIDGIKTDITAGYAALLRVNGDNLEASYNNGKNWIIISKNINTYFRWIPTDKDNEVGKIQMSRDKQNWQDLSPVFSNNLKIKGYVAEVEELPIDAAQGDIYMVGPIYDEEDVTQNYPHYRMWVRNEGAWKDNGEFTSLLAGITQNITTSENTVPSNRAISSTLGFQEESPEYIRAYVDSENKLLFAINNEGTVILANTQIQKLLGNLVLNGTISLNNNSVFTSESPEWIKVLQDSSGKVIMGITIDGEVYIPKLVTNSLLTQSEGQKEDTVTLKQSAYYKPEYDKAINIDIPQPISEFDLYEIKSIEELKAAIQHCNNVKSVCAILKGDLILQEQLILQGTNDFTLLGNGHSITSITSSVTRQGYKNGFAYADYNISELGFSTRYLADDKVPILMSNRTFDAASRMLKEDGSNFPNAALTEKTQVKFLLPEELQSLNIQSPDNIYIQYTTQYKSYIEKVDKFEDGYCYFTCNASAVSSRLCPDADYYFQNRLSRVTFYNLFTDNDSVHIRDNKVYFPAKYSTLSNSKWVNENKASLSINNSQGVISFKDINFIGGPRAGSLIQIGTSSDTSQAQIIISECTFESQDIMVYRSGDAKVYFINNTSNHCGQYGIVGGTYVLNNKFYYSGYNNDNDGQCVKAMGTNWYYANNYFENCNYCSLALSGSGIAEHNLMYYTKEYFDKAKDDNLMDGGAIYAGPYNTDIIIRYNTVVNYVGRGRNHGIYMDDGATHFTIMGNIIENVPRGYAMYAREVADRSDNTHKVALHNIFDNGIFFVGSSKVSPNYCQLGCNLINKSNAGINGTIGYTEQEDQYKVDLDIFNGMVRTNIDLKPWGF